MVEHNLDVIQITVWVIDLGPEGGAAGGRLVAEGRPKESAQVETSYNGAGVEEGIVGSKVAHQQGTEAAILQ